MTEKDLRTKRKRLFFDIETSPNIGLFWEAGYKKNIDHSNIIKERAIICICYKFEDEKEVGYLTWDSKQSDKKLLEKFIPIANSADELVGHNSDNFDLKWVRTRCLFHKIDMFPNYTTIDTLKIGRAKFRFNSNKLDYIAKFLGMGEKIKTEFGLWKDIVLNKDKVAMTKMVKYCQQDVKLLEKVFKEFNLIHIYY
jgi:DNA polymerase elongation subunit (family B)